MSAYTISMPVSAFFCVPFIRRNIFRVCESGHDVTPEPDHAANRYWCQAANHENGKTAKRLGVAAPYYHYDALSGRALVIDPPSPQGIQPKEGQIAEDN